MQRGVSTTRKLVQILFCLRRRLMLVDLFLYFYNPPPHQLHVSSFIHPSQPHIRHQILSPLWYLDLASSRRSCSSCTCQVGTGEPATPVRSSDLSLASPAVHALISGRT